MLHDGHRPCIADNDGTAIAGRDFLVMLAKRRQECAFVHIDYL